MRNIHIRMNWIEIPFFIANSLTLHWDGVKLFHRIGTYNRKEERLKYGLLGIARNIVASAFLKCDYARWVFALISHYCRNVFLALVAMGDRYVTEELIKNVYGNKRKISICHFAAFTSCTFDTVLGCAYQ